MPLPEKPTGSESRRLTRPAEPTEEQKLSVEDEGNRALERLPDGGEIRWGLTNLGDGWTVTLQEFSRFKGATADEAVDAALAARGSAAEEREIPKGLRSEDIEELRRREERYRQSRDEGDYAAAAPPPNVRERELGPDGEDCGRGHTATMVGGWCPSCEENRRLAAEARVRELEEELRIRNDDALRASTERDTLRDMAIGSKRRVRELEQVLREIADSTHGPGGSRKRGPWLARLKSMARAALAASPRPPGDEGSDG